ncbi:MAG TPA: hypothetical protein VF475_02150 [Sphingobium sp.]
MGATTHAVSYEDCTDGSFQVWWWNGRAPAGSGEIGSGGSVTMRASIRWIDASETEQVTRLVGADGASSVTVPDREILKFYGAGVRPKPGSHFWITQRESCTASCVFSHGKADYANGDALQYGDGLPDYTGTATRYGNSYAAAADYYGPVFIGCNGTRVTGVIDGDSREAGVLTSALADTSDNLYGARSEFGRLLLPYMALIDISVPGGTAKEMADPANTPIRDQLAKLAGRRFMGLGVNDIVFQGATSAQVAAWEETRRTRLGLPTTYKTISPVVTSATSNTLYSRANDPARQEENDRRRRISDTYDSAASTESGSTGTFASLSYTSDGTHLTAAGDKAGLATYNVLSKIADTSALNAGYQYASGQAYQSLGLADGWRDQNASLQLLRFYSPEHKITAAELKEDGSSNRHGIFKQIPDAIAGTTQVHSFFAKRLSGARNLYFQLQESDFSALVRVAIDLKSCTQIYASGAVGLMPGKITGVIEQEYCRISIVVTAGSGAAPDPYVFFVMTDAGGDDGYAGDGASSIAIWGYDVR